ncbi:MAG TPA: GxxExxY protein [Bacteroidales bacterium]|nr:GxxExxY protein [Bacteroidales bacterium]
MDYLHQDITKKIIRCFYNVYNRLGFGFLEKVYENALCYELKKANIDCINQYPVDVYYEDLKVGKYFADIIVENKVIIELKAEASICPQHEAQLVNYLKATDIEVGLLLNFGQEPKIVRKIFNNNIKK